MNENNILPYHCCICGKGTKRDICHKCYVVWCKDQTTPQWLRELRNELCRARYAKKRNASCKFPISFVSLEELSSHREF